jgi:transposase
MDTTIFVGLDVHKKTIAVATVEARASADVRFYGTIPNTPEAIRSMLRKLSKDGQQLHLAYEAGPLGYNLHRLSTGLGHRCDVVAPSLIPRKAGDKVKTDRRDAMMLAQLLRAGQLTEGYCQLADRRSREDGALSPGATRRRPVRRSRARRSSPRNEALDSRMTTWRGGESCGGWRSDRGWRRSAGGVGRI